MSRRSCHVNTCAIMPCYGWTRHRPISCVSHKLDGMFNVTRTICTYDACSKTASYGYIKRLFCIEHKDLDMVLIQRSPVFKQRSISKKPKAKSKEEIRCDIRRRSVKAAAIAIRLKERKEVKIKTECLQEEEKKPIIDPLNQIIFTMLEEDAKLLLQLRMCAN